MPEIQFREPSADAELTLTKSKAELQKKSICSQLNRWEQQDSATLLLTFNKSQLQIYETEDVASRHEKQNQP